MKIISELYKPNIACLPIGDRFTMGPREAKKALELLDIKTLIPMHFGTFPDLTGTPEEMIKTLKDTGVQVVTPICGDVIILGN